MSTQSSQAAIMYDKLRTDETELMLFYKGLYPIYDINLEELLAKDITIESNSEDFYDTITNPCVFNYFFPLPNQAEGPKFTPLCVEVFQKDNQIIYNFFSVVERALYHLGFNYIDSEGVMYRPDVSKDMSKDQKATFEQICNCVKMIYKDRIDEHKLSPFFKPLYPFRQVSGKKYEKGYLPKQLLSNVSRN